MAARPASVSAGLDAGRQDSSSNQLFEWHQQPSLRRYGRGQDEPFPYTLFPTEVLADPPFTVVHHLPDVGDSYQGVDVSHEIARYGVWQPNNILNWPPSLLDDFLVGLGGSSGKLLSGVQLVCCPGALACLSGAIALFIALCNF